VPVGGGKISRYDEHGTSLEVHARAEERRLGDAESLRLLSLPPARWSVAALIKVTPGHRPRPDQPPEPAPTGDVHGQRRAQRGRGPGGGRLRMVMAALDLPPGCKAAPVGRPKEMAKAGKAFLLAFVLSWSSCT
jgi:multidrug efflux pump subunit AcrB